MPLGLRRFTALSLGSLVALGTGLPAGGPVPTAAATTAAATVTTADYVVLADGPGAEIGTALDSIRRAGGTVVDVNPQLGVALARSAETGFLDTVRRSPGVRGAGGNHAVGTAQAAMPHRVASPRPVPAANSATATPSGPRAAAAPSAEPLADRQWNLSMVGATTDQAHRVATGAGVDVGIVDTGIDARHPDIAPNYDVDRSRNFTIDHPDLDGPCEVPSCVDPPDIDPRGHGTHVAGIVAAARNAVGISGVAPDARLVSLRAGQDSGYFFLYETADALTAAGDLGLDVVNMSFYTDPWLYNCTSREEYLSGQVTEEELAQQRLAREVVTAALDYAHQRGVTLVAAAGNEHTDLAAARRLDWLVPTVDGNPRTRTVAKSCINLPAEGPHVIGVGAVGPSGIKADYSNWGHPSVALVAPGGWRRDRGGATGASAPENLILSTYPTAAAIEAGLADAAGIPTDRSTLRSCDPRGTTCGLYTYLQGTSMASPHVVGVAALLIQRYGAGTPLAGYSLAPDQVAALLAATASDRPCPPGGVEDYTDENRPAAWNAPCTGTSALNELYGEGIASAAGL